MEIGVNKEKNDTLSNILLSHFKKYFYKLEIITNREYKYKIGNLNPNSETIRSTNERRDATLIFILIPLNSEEYDSPKALLNSTTIEPNKIENLINQARFIIWHSYISNSGGPGRYLETEKRIQMLDFLYSLENLIWIRFNNCDLPNFSINNFNTKSGYSQLRKLELFGCHSITNFDPPNSQCQLEELIINGSKINSFELNGNYSKLNILNLWSNQLKNIYFRFNEDANIPLKQLVLKFNKIEKLSEKVGKLSKIESIELQNNQLETLPESLGSLTQLTKLNVGHNQINILPNAIFSMSRSSFSIVFHDNQISEIPSCLIDYLKQGISTQYTFNLSNNQFKELPLELFDISVTVQKDLNDEARQEFTENRFYENLVFKIDGNPFAYNEYVKCQNYITENALKSKIHIETLFAEERKELRNKNIKILTHYGTEIGYGDIVGTGSYQLDVTGSNISFWGYITEIYWHEDEYWVVLDGEQHFAVEELVLIVPSEIQELQEQQGMMRYY